MELSLEDKALILAGVVWLAFIVAGIAKKPVKMSATVAVGGGFLVACVTAILGLMFFQSGLLALVGLFGVLWLASLVSSLVFGR